MEVQGLLRRIGCLDSVLAQAPALIDRARIFSPSGRQVEFTLGATALGFSRFALDELLFRHAHNSGAVTFEGVEVVKIERVADGERLSLLRRHQDGTSEHLQLHAELVVIAGGRMSSAPSRPSIPLFVGYKMRHRFTSAVSAQSLRGCVEVHLFDGGYCGVSETEGAGVNVCLLAKTHWLSSLSSSRWNAVAAELSRSSPTLGRRLSVLRADGEPLAVARIAFPGPSAAPSRHLRVGDAAGMIAPLCGDGQAMAIESAILLAELITRGESMALHEAWPNLWRRRFSRRLFMGRALQRILLRPCAAEAVTIACARWPFLVRFLVAATRGEFPTTMTRDLVDV